MIPAQVVAAVDHLLHQAVDLLDGAVSDEADLDALHHTAASFAGVRSRLHDRQER